MAAGGTHWEKDWWSSDWWNTNWWVGLKRQFRLLKIAGLIVRARINGTLRTRG